MIAFLNKKQFQFGFFAGLFILSLIASIYSEQYYFIAVPFAILLLYSAWQYRNVLFFLLLFSLPFSVEYHFSRTLGTDLPDEFLMLFVTGLFFFFWIYHPKAIPKQILLHPLLLMLFMSLIWIVLTVAFSTNHVISIKYFLAKCRF